jgi:hypothetical protein
LTTLLNHLEVNTFGEMIDNVRKGRSELLGDCNDTSDRPVGDPNDWDAIAWSEGSGPVDATHRGDLEIYD